MIAFIVEHLKIVQIASIEYSLSVFVSRYFSSKYVMQTLFQSFQLIYSGLSQRVQIQQEDTYDFVIESVYASNQTDSKKMRVERSEWAQSGWLRVDCLREAGWKWNENKMFRVIKFNRKSTLDKFRML